MAQVPEVDDEDERDAVRPEAPTQHRSAAVRAPLFKRWVIACLLVAAAAGTGALAWQLTIQAKWSRSAPRLDIRYEGAAAKLALPQAVSPSEEYLGPDGEVVFITQDELRAVNQIAALSSEVARELAGALAEREPARRSERLFALINDVPTTPDGDKHAMVVYRFVTAALAATADSPVRDDAKAKLDGLIGCRFVGPRMPPCPDRPSDVPMWGLVALALAALSAGGVGLATALVARRRALKAEEEAVAAEETSGDEVEEGA